MMMIECRCERGPYLNRYGINYIMVFLNRAGPAKTCDFDFLPALECLLLHVVNALLCHQYRNITTEFRFKTIGLSERLGIPRNPVTTQTYDNFIT